MKRRLLFPVVLVALCLGCGSDLEPPVLTAGDSGQEVLLQSGQRLEVRLESNPSTGYRWRVAPDSITDLVETISITFEPPTEDLVGAPGVEVLVFEARQAGAGILRLEYVREFDQPIVPQRIVEYLIRIDGVDFTRPSDGTPGTSTASVPPSGQDGSGTVPVADLVRESDPRGVVASGFLVWDDSGAKLCEVLLESYPAQCGGSAVEVIDPIQLDPEIEWDEAQGVRWTAYEVEVGGYFDGERLVLLEQTEGAED